MAAIGTGPALSDEEVRGTLATAVMAAEAGAELNINATKVARMAQEILDLRTSNGINASVAKRVAPYAEALEIANEVIRSLGGSKVEADFSKIDREVA